MGWSSQLFRSRGVSISSLVDKSIDHVISSEDEVSLTEIQKTKVKAAYHVTLHELFADLDRHQSERETRLEGELTERLALDMKSDSHLSKNVRPAILIFMTLVVAVLAFLTVFNSGLNAQQMAVLDSWIPFFQMVMMTIYGFYFGSRGAEKIFKIRAGGSTSSTVVGTTVTSLDQEPKG